MGRDFYELTDKERFLLTIFAYLPNLPVKAKDLFYLLDIKGEDLVEWFDALHNLTEDWLEYKDEHYIISPEKAKFLRNEIDNKLPVDLLIDKLKSIYENPTKIKRSALEYYEPFVLSVIKFYSDKSISLGNLIHYYARTLYHLKYRKDADLFYKQAINYFQDLPAQYEHIKPIKIANIWAEMGANNYIRGNVDQAYLFANKALDYLKKVPTYLTNKFDYKKAKAIAYKIIGSYFITEKQYSKAISYLLRTIEQFELSTASAWFIAESHLWLAYSYFKLNDTQNGFKHLDKAEKILIQYNIDDKLINDHIKKMREFYSTLEQIKRKLSSSLFSFLKTVILIILLTVIVAFVVYFFKTWILK